MTRSTRLPRLTLAALSLAALGAFWSPARAQDEEPKPGDGAAETAPEAATAADLEALVQRMDSLYVTAAHRPEPVRVETLTDEEEKRKARSRNRSADVQWKHALTALGDTAAEYLEAVGDGTVDPVALYYRGFALLERAGIVPLDEGQDMRREATLVLERYLASAPADHTYLGDGRIRAVSAYLFTAADAPDRMQKAAALLPEAVEALRKEGRTQEASTTTGQIMQTLLLQGQFDGNAGALDALARLAETLDVANTDFGPNTPRIRRHANGARVRLDAPLPELPHVLATDGEPLVLGDLRGKVVVLHFFNGEMSRTTREVEHILRPLHDRLHDKGLEMVGISTDFELTDEELERRRRVAVEIERDPASILDGRLDSVSEWVRGEGLTWRWYWDGKGRTECVPAHHYGVPDDRPWAILIDREGVVRFAGEPFRGLQEKVEELLGSG